MKQSKLRPKGIDKIVIHYDRYNPTRGGSYIELPKWIADKKSCINIKNEDNKCAKYSIQCGFYNVHDKKTHNKYDITQNWMIHDSVGLV